jgi:hypothetical protein
MNHPSQAHDGNGDDILIAIKLFRLGSSASRDCRRPKFMKQACREK